MDFIEIIGPIENSTPAHLPKAILWGPESVLMDSVEFFLKAGAKWDVVKLPSESGSDYLLQRVNMVRPKVIILCQEKAVSDATLLMRLAQLQICPKVVTVSLESNLMQVYSRQDVMMHDISDLLFVVDIEYCPNIKPKEEVQATK